jgi:hypothetical protein
MTWNVKVWKLKQVSGAIWQYLNQPLFDAKQPMVWQLSRFWYAYKIQMLEKCLKTNGTSQRHYTQ